MSLPHCTGQSGTGYQVISKALGFHSERHALYLKPKSGSELIMIKNMYLIY